MYGKPYYLREKISPCLSFENPNVNPVQHFGYFIYLFIFFFFVIKIRLDLSCESSARLALFFHIDNNDIFENDVYYNFAWRFKC